MTTSELEKWVSSKPLGTEHFYNIGLAEGKWKGFLHAIEVLENLSNTYANHDFFSPAIFVLKAYAGEKNDKGI